MSRGRRSIWVGGLAAGAVACATLPLAASPARGETLESALVQAYQNNPTLNSQRAAMRATDEGVPQALSGYRPKITDHRHRRRADVVDNDQDRQRPASATYSTVAGYNSPAQVGATITQTLYNGFQTANQTRQAESAVLAARATLARRPSRPCCSTPRPPT